MKLQITKKSSQKHIILYSRDDGSETWMHADDFFVLHDLSHYAIEKTLGYKTAFMGMLNNGMEINDFENREKRKQIAITQEAVYAENMANLFLMETSQGNFEDFNKILEDSFKPMDRNLSAPVLTEMEIFAIRKYLRQLLAAWKELPSGGKIYLDCES